MAVNQNTVTPAACVTVGVSDNLAPCQTVHFPLSKT
jgi:hypothetical protein